MHDFFLTTALKNKFSELNEFGGISTLFLDFSLVSKVRFIYVEISKPKCFTIKTITHTHTHIPL